MTDTDDFRPRKARCICKKVYVQDHENHRYCHWRCYLGEKMLYLKDLSQMHGIPIEQLERWSQTRSLHEIQAYVTETDFGKMGDIALTT